MTKMKLTDAQRVILAAAGARETGLLLPLPKSLARKRVALEADLKVLVTKSLASERPALAGEEPWTTAETGERTSLVITEAGLAAVGMSGEDAPTAAPAGAKVSKTRKASASKSRPNSTGRAAAAKNDGKAAKTKQSVAAASSPRTTKLDLLIAAMRSKKGATIDDLTTATGWQKHSIRGAISGALKKKREMNVKSESIDGRGRVYRITE